MAEAIEKLLRRKPQRGEAHRQRRSTCSYAARQFWSPDPRFHHRPHRGDRRAGGSADRGRAGPTRLKLSDILVTHHHEDHVAGIAALKAAWNCRVVAAKADAHRIPAVDETVAEGDRVAVGSLEAEVIDTPGHTVGHIAYWFRAESALFAADTLFSLGCGWVFEGTPGEMRRRCRSPRPARRDPALLRPRIHRCPTPASCPHRRSGKRRATDRRAARGRAPAGRGRRHPAGDAGAEKRENPPLRADDPGLGRRPRAWPEPTWWAVFAGDPRTCKNRF